MPEEQKEPRGTFTGDPGQTTGDLGALYAWVEHGPDGRVGVIITMIPSLGIQGPLLSRRLDIALDLGPLASSHAAASGRRVSLREFRAVRDLRDA